MRKGFLVLLLALLPPTFGAGRAAGQGWTFDVYGGRVAYDLAESVPGSNSAIIGARYREPDVGWMYVSSGLPLGSEDSTWGAAGAGRRLMRRERFIDLGLDLGAHGYLYRDPNFPSIGSGGGLEFRPLAAVGRGSVRLEGRSGWVGNRTSFAGEGQSRGVHDSDARLNILMGSSARVSGVLRHVRADEGGYTYGEGQLTVRSGRLTAWGSVGTWTSEALPITPWATGLSVVVDNAGSTRLGVSLQQDASDPIYWNAARRRWSVGLSHTLGIRSQVRPVPLPVVAAPGAQGTASRIAIRIPILDSGGGPPSIAGDFTGWKPVPMVREGDHWSAAFRIEPGVYRYAFQSPSGDWYVPESLPSRRPDGMGGFVATLFVLGDR